MTQQEFLRDAKERLGLTWPDFAKRIGAPKVTLKNWIRPSDSVSNYREMPSTIWILVNEILEHEAVKSELEELRKKINYKD